MPTSIVRICSIQIGIIPTTTRHTFHIKDCVAVYYRDYWDHNQARSCHDQQCEILARPRVEYYGQKARKNDQFEHKEHYVLFLVVHDAKLLMVCKTKHREETMENVWCVTMFF